VTTSSVVNIRRRPFGATDLSVSELGLGCARIGGIFQQHPGDFVDVLSAAFDAGINFFDTADIYSQGESERLLGRAFRGRREQIVIASKAGYVLPAQRRFAGQVKPLLRPLIRFLGLSRHRLPSAVRGPLAQDFSPGHLYRAVEGSLRRLATDRIDLLQLHSPPVATVRGGDWIEALDRLQQQGKIRYYGVSCDSPEAALAALQHRSVSSIQVPLNLLERRALETVPRARELGVGVIARECLANGLLAKGAAEVDVRSYCQSDEEAAAKAVLLESYREAAARDGRSLAQSALQFVRDLDGVSVSLIGVSRIEQLRALIS
jgi:aryl-alcohol dehydrogenase-like predicted oxidoreductase